MIVTFDIDILDRMNQPDFKEYLKSLYDEDPTGTVHPEKEWFLSNFDAAYPMAEKLTGGLQCIFNCAKAYMACRAQFPNYPEALQCDEEGVQCFANCYYVPA